MTKRKHRDVVWAVGAGVNLALVIVDGWLAWRDGHLNPSTSAAMAFSTLVTVGLVMAHALIEERLRMYIAQADAAEVILARLRAGQGGGFEIVLSAAGSDPKETKH